MVRRTKVFLMFFTILACSANSFAADSTGTSALSWSGFVDAYYSYNFNHPWNRMNQMRNFDIYENQLALNLVQLSVKEKAQPVGFRIDLGFGPTNDIVQGVPPYGTNTISTLSLLEQAYLEVKLPVGSGLTVDAGKFVSFLGLESIGTNSNWNYSRSLLFTYAVPYYHTGVKLSYDLENNLNAALYVVNGWNNVIDNNNSKSVGLSMSYSPSSSTTLTLNGISGNKEAASASYGKRDVVEIIINQQAGSLLSFAADIVYGREWVNGIINIWKGAALYAKYSLGSRSDLALRGEIYYDPQGYTTQYTFHNPTFKEVTLTYEYDLFKNLIVRGEFRDDFANGPAFDVAKQSALGVDSQPTLLVGAIMTF